MSTWLGIAWEGQDSSCLSASLASCWGRCCRMYSYVVSLFHTGRKERAVSAWKAPPNFTCHPRTAWKTIQYLIRNYKYEKTDTLREKYHHIVYLTAFFIVITTTLSHRHGVRLDVWCLIHTVQPFKLSQFIQLISEQSHYSYPRCEKSLSYRKLSEQSKGMYGKCRKEIQQVSVSHKEDWDN